MLCVQVGYKVVCVSMKTSMKAIRSSLIKRGLTLVDNLIAGE